MNMLTALGFSVIIFVVICSIAWYVLLQVLK